ERIPAFQPNDLLPFVRFLNQQRINFILVASRFARRFADVSDFSIVPRPAERLGICKVIVNDRVRILDALLGTQCYQAGVAWAGTNEINLTSLTHAQSSKPLPCSQTGACNRFNTCTARRSSSSGGPSSS